MSEARDNIEFLLSKFKVERYSYLVISILCIILLGVCVYFLLAKDDKDIKQVLLMLGPTGVITYSTSRLLKIWSDCYDLIKKQ